MAPDDNPFDTGSGTTATATAPTPTDATKDKPVTASTDTPTDSRPDSRKHVTGSVANDKTASLPAQAEPAGQAPAAPTTPAAQVAAVAPLLVVVKDGKISYADPAVVVVNADDVLADGNGADEIVAALKSVATTRDDAGRAALTDEFMAEVRTRLGL